VGSALGRTFTGADITELIRLDIASWLHLQTGMVTLVEQVAAAGHRLALLSNAPAELAAAVTALPVAVHFEELAFSCFLRSAKPDPACYQAVLDKVGAIAGEVIFLDDRPENVAAAVAMGIRGVQVTSPAAARSGLAAHGVLAPDLPGTHPPARGHGTDPPEPH
jgi:putative hydrolase of the HAD superfamily